MIESIHERSILYISNNKYGGFQSLIIRMPHSKSLYTSVNKITIDIQVTKYIA